MSSEILSRRLAAILSVDVVGYSRLMERDEAATLTAMKTHRRELWAPQIEAFGGRIVGTAGDSLLVEYLSAVAAVQSGIAVQDGMMERERGRPADQRMRLRVGINIGEVIVDGDDIFGDGVNVAARLQALSEPDGICISDELFRQIEGKLDCTFTSDGEHQVKNIARPVKIWRWRPDGEPDAVGDAAGDAAATAATAGTADPAGAVRPSIAVLPFANMSGDPEQEFFADGITEDILTELSRFRELLVISRTSAFAYKGKSLSIADVAKELDVQFIVEGSVRKAGNRVRITVQLIDAASDHHIWAERYDRDLEDIFEIQDEVTRAIVSTLPGRVEAVARERVGRKPPESMAAYENVITGKVLHHRSDRACNDEAMRRLDRAIELDPNYAHAYAWKACVLGQRYVHGWYEDRDATQQAIGQNLEIALSLDENDSDVHRILAALNLITKDFERARQHQERALSLNPNDDLIVVQHGEILTWLGRPDEGIEWIRKAMRLNPFHPERFWGHLGRAHYSARQYDEAVAAFQQISKLDAAQHALMAAACAQAGDPAAAKNHARDARALDPKFSIEAFLDTLHYARDADRAHQREGLEKAGLPA